MSYCCSQCSFTAQFESALIMHHQLHHESSANDDFPVLGSSKLLKDKPNTTSQISPPPSPFYRNKKKGLKLPGRTSSATRLFGKLKAHICKSRTLFVHPEVQESNIDVNNLSILSDCTSKAMRDDTIESRTSAIIACLEDQKETYGCHLCPFEADRFILHSVLGFNYSSQKLLLNIRITVLDRHLLNQHKIGLENLLKLVMSKTKDGLSDERNITVNGIRQPYYRPRDEMIEEGEFIIETVTPKVKILKHASTNTEQNDSNKDFNLERNCQMISKEIESMLNGEMKYDNKDFLSKMQTLNACMCKFVSSSNTLKKVLTKEFDSKVTAREHFNEEPFFNLGLGDRSTPRNWERAHSEKIERSLNKYMENSRAEKTKPSAESFYF